MILPLLQALKAQLLANVAMVDALMMGIQQANGPEKPDACPHPREDRVDIGIMGAPQRYLCKRCGAVGGTDEAAASQPPPGQEG